MSVTANLPKASGIYSINVNNKIYIGSSCNVSRRIICHFSKLKYFKHLNHHIQHLYNKYSENNFSVNVLELWGIDELLVREQYYINKFNDKNLINVQKDLDIYSSKLTEEIRSKFSSSNIGKKRSDETKRKMSISKLGIKFSNETKERMSIAHKKNVDNRSNRAIVAEDAVKLITDFNNGTLPKVLSIKYNISTAMILAILNGKVRDNLCDLVDNNVLILYKNNNSIFVRKKKSRKYKFY